MKNYFFILSFLLCSIGTYAQSNNVTIYDKFYMNPVSPTGLSQNVIGAPNFLMSVTQERTNKTYSAGCYFDNALKVYVFNINPAVWTDVRETDMFTITIQIRYGTGIFTGGMAYAGLINPIIERRSFTAKCTGIALSGISRGIPIYSPRMSSQ